MATGTMERLLKGIGAGANRVAARLGVDGGARGPSEDRGRPGTGGAAKDGGADGTAARPVDLPDELLGEVDERAIGLMSRYGVPLMRLSLGTTFIWFGALKLVESSPVGDLVANTVYWLPPRLFVPFLGAWEIAVGLGLITGRAPRTTLAFFLSQMAGTFLVLVVKPEVAFQRGNPLLLTTEGEFVVKNLVLISGGLIVGSTMRRDEKAAER